MRNTKSAQAVLTIVLAAVLNPTVSAWSTAVHAPLPFPGLPASPIFENQTVRMIVRPTIGGERVRIRLSNAFGTAALKIGSAHVALASKASAIDPGSDHALTFGGALSVSIPAGAPILSDPVDMKVLPFKEIAVTIYVPEKTPSSTVHFWAQHETYISGAGDFSAKPDIPSPTTTTSWYWLADVEVWVLDEAAATVTLGDSITDGVGAKQGEYADWPDMLANRLAGTPGSATLAVDNDVLAQPGVANLIVLEGINDIGWPHMKPRLLNGTTIKETPFTHEVVSAEDLIMGLQQLVERAHQHGIKVFGATVTPYEGADYYNTDGEATRQAVNKWIRTSGGFDGVFDFDAAVRDPNHPTQFREGYHSGDHLHPSATGYKAMADAVDISLLRSGRGVAKKK
ncbi:MAG: GDSL family lipase [Acidobacteria bacterium]|nr:MAG: GDSL family lipase [Acidobacteriota bacterium]